ncbi:YxeA family protein [Staphylococcus durrellii]|uniref:YxeA family protein n=1 Tax=Staphylococcus durrellii TaxID=2781773 RepID=UPI00189F4C7B|nr:YxeA family protein [Staphylococcus durrellii]MBF7016646.1 YxeA family protein [Staphylococcus durrellii]
MKILYSILTIIIIILLALYGWKYYAESHTNNQTVRNLANFNPLIKNEKYYVQIDYPESTKNVGKGIEEYKYKSKAFKKDGKEKKLKYMATKKLKRNHYLELDYKVGEVKNYKEVHLSKIPKKAKEKLKE